MTDGDDFVASPSDDAIVRSIRERYIRDASLAIVLIGASTWARRFVDWEIAAAGGSAAAAPLPFVLFDLDPPSRNRTPLPPRLTSAVGPTCRVDATLSLVEVADAISRSLTAPSSSGVECKTAGPLLRRDLH